MCPLPYDGHWYGLQVPKATNTVMMSLNVSLCRLDCLNAEMEFGETDQGIFFFFFAVSVDFVQGGEEKNKLNTIGLFLK